MQNFAIFKNNDKKNDKAPDYTISVKVEDNYVTAGGCWLKEGKSGKFFSCKLSEPYKDRPGFHIEVDLPKVETPEEKTEKTVEYPNDDISADSIPF